jgi:hypothetical protein
MSHDDVRRRLQQVRDSWSDEERQRRVAFSVIRQIQLHHLMVCGDQIEQSTTAGSQDSQTPIALAT